MISEWIILFEKNKRTIVFLHFSFSKEPPKHRSCSTRCKSQTSCYFKQVTCLYLARTPTMWRHFSGVRRDHGPETSRVMYLGNLIAYTCVMQKFRSWQSSSPLAPLQGGIDMCTQWVYCGEFNFQQFLFKPFFIQSVFLVALSHNSQSFSILTVCYTSGDVIMKVSLIVYIEWAHFVFPYTLHKILLLQASNHNCNYNQLSHNDVFNNNNLFSR